MRIDVAVAGGDFDAQHGHEPISHGLPSPKAMAEAVHGVFHRAGHAVGVVHPADSLAGVKLYVVPHLAIFDPAWVPALEKFVAGGGVLVVGARSACRDLRSNVVPDTLPGCLRPLVGASVEEYGKQNRPDRRPLALRFAGADADTPTTLWYEQLAPDTASGTEIVEREHPDGRVLRVIINHREEPVSTPPTRGASCCRIAPSPRANRSCSSPTT